MPLSAATTRYGSSLVEGSARSGGRTTSPPTMLSVRSSMPRISVEYAQLHLGAQRVALGGRRCAARTRPWPDRHDHGVLDHLGLHQPEHLGAVVLAAVRPADAAARDRARRAGGCPPSAGGRRRSRRAGAASACRGTSAERELERQVRRGRAVRRSCAPSRRSSADEARAGCGPRRGCPRRPAAASSCARSSPSPASSGASQKRARNSSTSARAVFGCEASTSFWYGCGERRRDDLAVAAVGAQDRDVVATAARRGTTSGVERVRLGAPAPDRRDGLGDPLAAALAVELGVVDQDAEVVQVGAVVTAVEPRRHLLHDRQAEGLEHREQLAAAGSCRRAWPRRPASTAARPPACARPARSAARRRMPRPRATRSSSVDVLRARASGGRRGLVVVGQPRA